MLGKARKELAAQESVRGGDEKNYSRVLERLQKYKDGGVSDVRTFAIADGLSWQDSAERTFNRSKEELVEWIGARASAGRLVPKGFPRSGKF